MAKLADAPDLGSGGEILRGSSPLPGRMSPHVSFRLLLNEATTGKQLGPRHPRWPAMSCSLAFSTGLSRRAT